MVKAVLIDFDGTVVTGDILTELCGLNGRARESHELNEAFFRGELPGVTGLVQRINLLAGLSLQQIDDYIDSHENLMPGAEEFFAFLNANKIVSILNSGGIIPVLQRYQQKLGITHVIGPQPDMDGDTIVGISESVFPPRTFKLEWVKSKLQELGISPADTISIGDSPADIPLFELAGYSICINPKHGAEAHANAKIPADLTKAIPYIQERIKTTPA